MRVYCKTDIDLLVITNTAHPPTPIRTHTVFPPTFVFFHFFMGPTHFCQGVWHFRNCNAHSLFQQEWGSSSSSRYSYYHEGFSCH